MCFDTSCIRLLESFWDNHVYVVRIGYELSYHPLLLYVDI